MGYMIEGGGSKTMSKAKAWLYEHPQSSRDLLKIITDVIVDYLIEQVAGGAQVSVFPIKLGHLSRKLQHILKVGSFHLAIASF